MSQDHQPPAVRYGLLSQEKWNEMQEALQAEDRERFLKLAVAECCGNPPLFGHIFLGYDVMPHFVPVWMAVENNDDILIHLPRSHGKSVAIGITLPLHHICYSTIEGSGYEEMSILLLQESTTAAQGTVKAIQEALEPPGPDWRPQPGEVRKDLIQQAFGDLKGQARTWNNDTISLMGKTASKEYTLYGRGVQSAITGAHPKYIICDDVVTRENSKTEHLRDSMWKWWTQTLLGVKDPGTKTIILGTPYYDDDLYQRLMETNNYKVIKRPALNDPIEDEDFDVEYDEEGEKIEDIHITEKGERLKALWPCPLGTGNCPRTEEHFDEYGQHRPVEFLIKKYLENPVGFATQFMLEVLGSQDSRIKPSMLRFYSHEESDIGQATEYNEYPVKRFPHPEDVVAVVHSWDHAIGKKSAHDNTAFARAIRTKKNNVFFDVRAGKWGFEEAIRKMESFYESEPFGQPRAIVTEAVGFQEAYSESLMERSKKMLPIEPVKKGVDKDQFLVESQLLTAMTNGQVFFDIHDKETLKELLAFTPDGSSGYHDDRVDAVALAFNYIKDAAKRNVKVHRVSKKRRRNNSRRGFQRWRRGGRRP